MVWYSMIKKTRIFYIIKKYRITPVIILSRKMYRFKKNSRKKGYQIMNRLLSFQIVEEISKNRLHVFIATYVYVSRCTLQE